MVKKKFKILNKTFIIALFASFLLGFLFHYKKFFPYYQIQYVYHNFFYNFVFNEKNNNEKNNKITKKNIILKKEISFESLLITEKTVNTHTLPLKIKTYDLSMLGAKKFVKGGMCTLNKKVIFFYNNNFYFLEKNILYRLNTNFLSEKMIVTSLECLEEKNNIITFFFNIVESQGEQKFANKIIKGEVNIITKKTNTTELLNLDTETINGAGKILIFDSENLFISFNTPDKDKNLAQDPTDIRGKIILVNIKSKNKKIYSSGHRNPQGLFMDKKKNFFATEHGPYGGDELNLILSNKNYGWPLASDGLGYYSETYEKTYGEIGRHSSNFEKPIFSWTPGIGISDLLRVNTFDESWRQDLLITSLKNKTLYRIRLNKIDNNFAVKYIESIWIGHRIRHIEESLNEKIYLMTDDDYLIEISKIKKGKDKWVDTRNNVCLSCHNLGVTNQTNAAPTLVGIFNRQVGSDPNYQYSKAFKNKKFKWDKGNMIKYLLDPQKFLPGTTKPFKATSIKEAIKLVEALERIAITTK